MNCQECQNQMQRRLDGDDFVEAAALESHLAECQECRQLHAAARRLEEGLRLLPTPIPSAGFTERMVQQVLVQRRRHRYWQVAGGVGSLAAAVLVAVLGVHYWPTSAPSETPAPVVADIVPQPQPVQPPSLSDSMAEVSSAVASLARRTTSETVDQTRMLWPDPMTVETPEPMSDLAVQSLWEAGQGVSAGLSPVTTSARRAVDLFLRELPPMPAGPEVN